jgi:hypothetical protein
MTISTLGRRWSNGCPSCSPRIKKGELEGLQGIVVNVNCCVMTMLNNTYIIDEIMVCYQTVRPMNFIWLTSLQKSSRAQWLMLFHPKALRLEFCNPLTSGHIQLSCAYCALIGWNSTQKTLLSSWFCNPLTSGQVWLSYIYCALTGWSATLSCWLMVNTPLA